MKTLYLFIFSLASCLVFTTKAQDFIEHQLASGYNSWSAVAVDMDDDGDIDIVGSSRLNSRVSWWENDGEENFTLHPIATDAAYAMGVCGADLDSDGDIDVICAVQEADAVVWWENDGTEVYIKHTLANILSPSYIDTCDLDLDNDMDILVAACEDGSDKIVWCENTDNLNFTTHIIKANWDHANSVHAADMDYDGDMDVLGTASFRTHPSANGEITWFENDGNQVFSEHTIINDYGRPSCVIAVDIDHDLDMDVIASVCLLNRIVLFENNGDLTFSPTIIASGFYRPHDVFAQDLDNDLDIDILGTAIDGNQIAWWENEPAGFTKHIISSSFGGATCATAGDIDNDGDMDVLGTAQFDYEIAWWENSLFTGIDESVNDSKQQDLLQQNIPNPFNQNTSIRFRLLSRSLVSLVIYNESGSLIKTILSKELPAGDHSVIWDGRSNDGSSVSHGIYYYKLRTNKQTETRKMLKSDW